MAIRIETLSPKEERQYRELLFSSSHNLLYASLEYRNFLRKILPESQDFYLVAYESGRWVGALPSFLLRNKSYGNVLNSLPFYGSNGGFILHPKSQNAHDIKMRLLAEFRTLAEENNVIASTIISNPFFPEEELYYRHTDYTFQDQRIGQIVIFPNLTGDERGIGEYLMKTYHQKTRNMVRKAQKSGVVVGDDDSMIALKILSRLHRQNIEAMGGRPKNWAVFEAIRATFVYGKDYKVYLAYKDRVAIAALLILFFNRTAEYFVPAIHKDFRTLQPMSLLIFEAMQEAVGRGILYWNWARWG